MKELKKISAFLDIVVDDLKEHQFREYMEGILEKNQYINLTAITENDEFIRKHYIDSLLCSRMKEFRAARNIIDVGTGGGFPGVPLAIAFPEKEFVLIDSLNKRIKVINELCERSGITNVKAIHGRAEEIGRKKEMRGAFDVCVSRAVANMSTLSEYCIPFVKKGGVFIAYKGPGSADEIAEASEAISVLGGKLVRQENPFYEGLDFNHKLIVIKKVRNTSGKYPRKAGTPSKEPIRSK